MKVARSRILWKEYRTYRSLWWTALACAAVLLLWFGFSTTLRLGRYELDKATFLWATALGVPLLYAMAVTSTIFNRESADGTDSFLRSLPIHTSNIWPAKVGFVAASSVLLLMALFLATWTIIESRSLSIRPAGENIIFLLSILTLLPLSAAIGLVISVSWRRPLLGFCLTGFLAFVLLQLLVIVFPVLTYSMFLWVALATLGLLTVSSRKTAKWLELDQPMSLGVTGEALAIEGRPRGRRLAVLASLSWLFFRQFGWLVAPAGLYIACWFSTDVDLVFVFPYAVWPTVLGLLMFAPDQMSDHREYYSDRGVVPGRLWVNRQLIGGAIFLFLLSATQLIRAAKMDEFGAVASQLALLGPSLAILSYGVGLVCGLLIRSPLVATLVAFVPVPVIAFWSAPISYFQLPFALTTLLPFAFLLMATYQRMGSWLNLRDRMRDRLASSLIVVAGCLVSYFGLGWYRISEVPLLPNGIDTQDVERLIENRDREKIATYVQVEIDWRALTDENGGRLATLEWDTWNSSGLTTSDREKQWVTNNASTIELGLQAAKRPPSCLLALDDSNRRRFGPTLVDLTHLLLLAAREAQPSRDFETMSGYYHAGLNACADLRLGGDGVAHLLANRLEHKIWYEYVFLISAATKINEIDALATRVEDYLKIHPDWSAPIVVSYLLERNLLSQERLGFGAGTFQLPGEKDRLQRLLALTRHHEIEELQRAQELVAAGALARHRLPETRLIRLNNTSLRSLISDWKPLLQSFVHLENHRRLIQVAIKIQRYRIVHGKTPKLSEISGDSPLYADAYIQRPFELLPPDDHPRRIQKMGGVNRPVSYFETSSAYLLGSFDHRPSGYRMGIALPFVDEP